MIYMTGTFCMAEAVNGWPSIPKWLFRQRSRPQRVPEGSSAAAYDSGSDQYAGSGSSLEGDETCDDDSYVNSDGHCVHNPVAATTAPDGASAQCNDGTYSFSEHRRGTCIHHGGVAEWL